MRKILVPILLLITVSVAMAEKPDSLLNVYKADVMPIIDGVMDSIWIKAEPVGITALDAKLNQRTSSIDYSGWMKLLWDENNLYLYFSVMDDDPYSTDDGALKPDQVELHFDGDNSGGWTKQDCIDHGVTPSDWWWNYGNTTVYDSLNDIQVKTDLGYDVVNLGNQGPGMNFGRPYYWDFSSAVVAHKINEDDLGYSWEFSIPWTAMHIDPAKVGEGYQIGFNPQLNDYDEAVVAVDGSPIRRLYYWIISTNGPWIGPSEFGTLVLSEQEPIWESHIYKTDSAPTIDGIIDDIWVETQSKSIVHMDAASDTNLVKSSIDHRGWMKALWDDANLYLLFNVNDDILLENPDNVADVDVDQVELFFDGDNSGGWTQADFDSRGIATQTWWWEWGETIYDSLNDVQITNDIASMQIGLGNRGPGANFTRGYWDFSSVQVGYASNEDYLGYVVEYAIPWTALKVAENIGHGYKVGFNVQLNDFDDDVLVGDNLGRRFYTWKPNNNTNWINPSALATFVLVVEGEPLAVEQPGSTQMPQEYVLQQNYPNPFNPTTTISYRLEENAFVQLQVFNSLGQKVKVLMSNVQSQGEHKVVWDGRNQAGELVPSGIYFYKIHVQGMNNTFTNVRKMVLAK